MKYFLLIFDNSGAFGEWIFWMQDKDKEVLRDVAERMNNVPYFIIEGSIVVGDLKKPLDMEYDDYAD